MRHYKQTLEHNQSTEIAAHGDFLHLYTAAGRLEITVGQSEIILEEGVTFRTPFEFNNLRMKNVSGEKNTFNLLVGLGDYVPPIKISGNLKTQTKSGGGQLFKSVSLNGRKKLLDFNADRLHVRIQNKTEQTVRIGGKDVLVNYIELKQNELFTNSTAPILEMWAMGEGKLNVSSTYTTQQDIAAVEELTFNNEELTFNNEYLTFYK